MKGIESRKMKLVIVLSFCLLLVFEIMFYQYDALKQMRVVQQSPYSITGESAERTFIEAVRGVQTISTDNVISGLERNRNSQLRLGVVYLILIELNLLWTECKRKRQFWEENVFVPFFQNFMEILHKWHGKKDNLFLYIM